MMSCFAYAAINIDEEGNPNPLFQTPAEGASTGLWTATATELAKTWAVDPGAAKKLWALSVKAPGTISYHLVKLASVALIEQAPPEGIDRRERWWRATASLTNWEPVEMLDDREKFAASSALQKLIAQEYAAQFTSYIDAMPSLPREWVAAAASGDRSLR